MRAARFYGVQDIRVEDVSAPSEDVGAGSVLVEVKWCGICGSDLHLYTAGICQPHPRTMAFMRGTTDDDGP